MKTFTNPLTIILLTGVSMFQSMTLFKGFDYHWPADIQRMLDAFQSSGGFQMAGIQCMVASITTEYVYANAVIQIFMGPMCIIACGLGLVFIHFFRLYFGFEFRPHYNLRKRFVIVSMYVFFLFQPSAIQAAMMVFTCYDVGGERLLYYQMSINCADETYQVWSLAVGGAVVLIGIIIPLYTLHMLVQNREGFINHDEDTLRTFGYVSLSPLCPLFTPPLPSQ